MQVLWLLVFHQHSFVLCGLEEFLVQILNKCLSWVLDFAIWLLFLFLCEDLGKWKNYAASPVIFLGSILQL